MALLPDPFGLLRVPKTVVRSGARVIGWSERQVLGVLHVRLERAKPLALPAAPPAEPQGAALGDRMSQLLERALEHTPQTQRMELFHRILDQVNPDEARILGALSDGSASPLVHVRPFSAAGKTLEATIENASLVGKMANVSLPHLTPQYVTHLISLGVLEIGPEDLTLKDEYQILTADTGVLRAIKTATRGVVPPRVERHTVRLSPLGRELWNACFPGEGVTS